jgi:hypothetical protein
MTASIQAAGTYADTNILFDWHKVEGIKGGNIDGIQTIVRGTNGADQTMADLELFFATSNSAGINQAPSSLGTERAVVSTYGWQNNLIGIVPVAAGNFNDGDLNILNIARSEPKSPFNIPFGEDLYVAAITKGSAALDFRSTVQVSTETATNTTAVVVKTTSALINFAPGDVLHDENDLVIGTVKSVTDATNIVLTENCASVSAVNKDLYNISPIQLIISSEE